MKLKLVLEQTQATWTLKPDRQYIVGSGQDCDITLPQPQFIADKHLVFYFDSGGNLWYVEDLASSSGTFINNEQITRFSIQDQTRIAIAGNIILVATPASQISTQQMATLLPPTSTQSTIQPPIQPPIPTFSQPPVQPPSIYSDSSPPISNYDPSASKVRESTYRNGFSQVKTLTWKEFVDKQVESQPGWLSRLATRFYMITGFRNTPWVRKYAGNAKEGDGFDAFDGYIIPEFKDDAGVLAQGIATELSRLRRYDNTDCFITKLTDAHIADSATQSFLGIELFPIQRAGKPDYRRFCVISYNRVRTYLLVENYGTDLFVSWITRFEPDPTPVLIGIWLGLSILLTLMLLTSNNLVLVVSPLVLWSAYYMLVPYLMQSVGILPKKANARLIAALILIPIIFILFSVISSLLLSGFGRRF